MHRNERHFANANRFIPSAFVKNKCTKCSNYMRLHLKAENRIDENMSSHFLSIWFARAGKEGGGTNEGEAQTDACVQFAVFCFLRCINVQLEIGSPFAGNLVDPFDGRPPLPTEFRKETDATRIPVTLPRRSLRSSGKWLVYRTPGA